MSDLDYRLFVLIVELGNISAAGGQIGLSPAAASKRLASLERRLGARLIRRTTRQLHATPEGQSFYDDVKAILAAAKAAEDRVVGRIATPSGSLRISAPTSFGRLHVAPHLQSFLDRFPEVRAELILDDAYNDLTAERIDIAIRIMPCPDENGTQIARLLAPNRRILCAAPSYLSRHGEPTSLEALCAHRLLAARSQTPWRLERGASQRLVEVQSAVVTNSSEVVRELALSGGGIALRSYWDVGSELATGALQRVLSPWEGASNIGVFAVYLADLPAPAAIKEYVDHLASAIKLNWVLSG